MTDPTPLLRDLGVDALAQEIRRVDGNHSLGAGALAEALMPFLLARLAGEGWQPIETAPKDRPVWVRGWDWGKPDTARHQGWAYWNGEQWQWADSSETNLAVHLTDWLSLPAPPALAPAPKENGK